MILNNLILNHCVTFRFCISEAHNIPDNKAAIKELIEKGGQVDMDYFDGGWDRNPIVATIWNEDVLIACGALKIPGKVYKKELFEERAKSDCPYGTIGYELGWIVTDEAYRGLGCCTNIVKMLLKYNETETGGSLYATTRQDNNSMQKILKCNGFCESGEPFKSKCGDYKLILFVRDVKTNEIYENE